MPTCSRFALTFLTAAALFAAAGVCQAGQSRRDRPIAADAPIPTSKADVVLQRAIACINAQHDQFKGGLQDYVDALEKLATDVNANTPEQDILDFADKFTKDLLDDQLKSAERINLITESAIKRFTRIGADPSYAMAVKSAADAVLADIEEAVADMLTKLDIAVEEALAIAAAPDSPK